ncbi:D-2-hydroxyacid dehydrogenase [Aerosakkonemataceae cyanobacterium BLCC-F50]|uniref:D-2-hydroxyacid dehydrogenase n=1 Tax=Floridaenema flaviceps BLCC-F50 TaxID=3153642 RepID=A0ABV4XP55_9CYAN
MHILLMYSTHKPSEEHLQRLTAIEPSIRVSVAESEETAIAAAKDADVIFGHRYLIQSLPYTQNLRWVQSTASGVDRLPCVELAQRQVMLTRMTLQSFVIARHAVTLAWAMVRCLPQALEYQKAGIWNQTFDWLPLPRQAIVFGTGNIGRAIAKLLKADGIKVTGVKRTVNGETLAEFDDLCDRQSWFSLLPDMDWCFLALPHTEETRDLFNETAMRALPSHAIIVNVGRGETLVSADLCRVLSAGHLGGAALDVLYPKPTSSADPFWQTPGLIVTPHVAAHHYERSAMMEQFCEQQLVRFINNQPLLDRVT